MGRLLPDDKRSCREITDNLFAGNRLAEGIKLPDGQKIDLNNITSPVVVFASWGDNITPPQQALNWIVNVYATRISLWSWAT